MVTHNGNPNAPARRNPNAVSSESPLFSPETFLADMRVYRDFQLALDNARPDLLIQTKERNADGKPRTFRPKRYWMLLARALGLRIELVTEERLRIEAHDDKTGEVWAARCVQVLFKCSDPKNPGAGESVGDGACDEAELTKGRRSYHNVRSRAYTRAICRAISNFVAFGDPVDADEDEPVYDNDPSFQAA
jgi:hypothetical protein